MNFQSNKNKLRKKDLIRLKANRIFCLDDVNDKERWAVRKGGPKKRERRTNDTQLYMYVGVNTQTKKK